VAEGAEAGVVWATEGEIKSDIAAQRLGVVVVSVPGVASWAAALPDIAELLPGGGRVVVAFDADWPEKPQVHRATWSLALACGALGYEVEVATWESTHKGLDDALVAGARIDRGPPGTIPPPAWTHRLRSAALARAPTRPAPATVPLAALRTALAADLLALLACPSS
jgi:hypothetical protein